MPKLKILRQEARVLPSWAKLYASARGFDRAYFFGGSPGDDMLMTAMLRESLRQRGKPAVVVTRFPELFQGNPACSGCVPPSIIGQYLDVRTFRRLVLVEYYNISDTEEGKRPVQRAHLMVDMCRSAGLTGSVRIRPEMMLTAEERRAGQISDRQIVIMPTSANARLPIRMKEWGIERFAEVSRILSAKYDVLQLGTGHDPLLPGARDLRGKTTLREAAGLISQSRCLVSIVGFGMHLARGVNCPSVIVFGGREHPSQSGYAGNCNLYSAVPCAPCWYWNRCDFDRRCMTMISPDHVVESVNRVVEERWDPDQRENGGEIRPIEPRLQSGL